MKSLNLKKPPKDQRERSVLFGLIDLYLESGKPVGSNTLRENGFESLSSATIRNYFAKLEEDGFLKQQHSSGGRIPTSLAYKLYATHHLSSPLFDEKASKTLKKELSKETREIATYLHHVGEFLSDTTNCAVFLSAPRFDHDFVLDIKLISVDQNRCLCVLITDFGMVQTELLYTPRKLSSFTLKRLEEFFRWKLTGYDKPKLETEEEALATKLYGEVMLRHLVGSSNFSSEDITRTGFSKLLNYPDFNDATALADGLSLFENKEALRSLLNECSKAGELRCWIGDQFHSCSVLAIPYSINHTTVGSIALLGPNRIPYRKLFGILQHTAEAVSDTLTKSIYKFKITFRQPEAQMISAHSQHLLLENKYARRT